MFKAGNNDPTRSFFFGYCTPTIEIKDFNGLIDSIPFFDKPVKTIKKLIKKLVEMSRNNDYKMTFIPSKIVIYTIKNTIN